MNMATRLSTTVRCLLMKTKVCDTWWMKEYIMTVEKLLPREKSWTLSGTLSQSCQTPHDVYLICTKDEGPFGGPSRQSLSRQRLRESRMHCFSFKRVWNGPNREHRGRCMFRIPARRFLVQKSRLFSESAYHGISASIVEDFGIHQMQYYCPYGIVVWWMGLSHSAIKQERGGLLQNDRYFYNLTQYNFQNDETICFRYHSSHSANSGCIISLHFQTSGIWKHEYGYAISSQAEYDCSCVKVYCLCFSRFCKVWMMIQFHLCSLFWKRTWCHLSIISAPSADTWHTFGCSYFW